MNKLLIIATLGFASTLSAECGCNKQKAQQMTETVKSKAKVSDQDLSGQIRNVLNSENYKNVTFQINNGNVVLKGSTNSIENIIALTTEISKIEGVQSVDNNLNVQLSNANDGKVAAEVQDLLGSDAYAKGNIGFQVNGGQVVLTGSVESEQSKNALGEAIKKLPGVTSIDNQLTIKK